MTPRYRVIAHHVSHLFPDVVSGLMSQGQADTAAALIAGDLPPGAGWTVRVAPAGADLHPCHLYRRE